ncbi:hypothetical protein DL991_18695 [Amycolatopsis sp. WAC 01375]|nr:hypothetical protein DL991_18695 [Amycolatopsis sp. WAC 01375]
MAERSSTRNDMSGTVVGTVIQANQVTLGEPRRSQQEIWMVPEPSRVLVERVELAEKLAEVVSPGSADAGVVGPGGFGKTTLVAQACRTLRTNFPGGVLWVTLGEHVPDTVLADKINDLCEMLDGVRPTLTDPAMVGHRLGELLAERAPTLLVLDDVWSASRLAPFPAGTNIARIVTTRSRGTLRPLSKVVPVGRMSFQESRALLVTGVAEPLQIERLTRLTGGWALLLSLVNSAICRAIDDGTTPEAAAELIADQLGVDGPDSLDLDSADRRDQAVQATVEASLRRLGNTDRGRFLELGIFPEDMDIPLEVVHLLWSASGLSAAEARRLGRRLADLSLITLAREGLRLHDVLRTYVRHTLGTDRLAEVNATLVDALRAEAPEDWVDGRPYALRHLAGHAADAGLLDQLVIDAGFLLAASQPELLATLGVAQGEAARAAALVYQRAAHHLRDQPLSDRPAYLALSASRAGATALADAAKRRGAHAKWHCSWTHWNSEPDHKILARHLEAVVEVAAVSLPDGRLWSVSRCLDGDVRIVDVESNESIVPPWQAQHVTAIACVPLADGRRLAVLGTWDDMQVWDLTSDHTVKWEVPHLGEPGVREIVWTEWSGRLVVIACSWDHTVHAWDVSTGKLIGKPISFECGTDESFWAIAAGLLPDGRLGVAVSDEYAPVRLWDLETGERVGAELAGHPLRTMEMAWGTRALFTSGSSTEVKQWNVLTGESAGPGLTGHSHNTHTLLCTWIPDLGEVLISGDDDGALRVWSIDSGDLLGGPVYAHAYSVRALACGQLRDGRTVVITGGNENTVRLWHLQELISRRSEPGSLASPATDLAYVGHLVVSRHEDSTVQAWDEETVAPTPSTLPLATSLSVNGTCVVSSHEDGTLRTWDPVGEQLINCWHSGLAAHAMACADRPSGKAIAILAGHGAGIEAWDLINGRRLWRVRTRVRTKWKAAGLCWPRSVTAVATTTLPDDRLVALSGGSDGTVRIWDLSTGEQVGTNMNCRVRGQPSPAAVSAIACTRLPDGRVVAIVGSENTTPATVTAWDLSTCRLLARSTIRTGWVDHAVCVMFPDGMPMAVTGDTVLRVWPLVGLAPDVEWEPKFEIDLDAPVTALASDGAGKLLAGTMHGLVQLHLRSDSESCGGS